MKKIILFSFVLYALFSCTPGNSDLKSFKKNVVFNNMQASGYFEQLAGIDGDVQYDVFYPEEYKHNKDIVGIDIFVTRNNKSRYKSFRIQYLYNKKLKNCQIHYYELNGKPVNFLELGFAINGMLLESANIK